MLTDPQEEKPVYEAGGNEYEDLDVGRVCVQKL